MILERKTNGELVWISADGIYIVTKNGRIIRTKGLINDLLKIEYGDLNFGDTAINSSKTQLQRCITLLINLS